MKCLCCGKEITAEKDVVNGWHSGCIKRFFGTSRIPDISLDKAMLEELAKKTVNKGLTIPGVQKKLSLHLEKNRKEARFTLVDYPTGYILKPQSADFDELPEAEHLAMTMARATGITVVPFSLIKLEDEYAYITKRVDKTDEGKLAMEDFCQLSGRSTADKYKGSYEECGKIVKQYSGRSGFDLTELYLRLVFCDVIGNSDMHLKNFSMKEIRPKSREYVLSEAYDLLPVNIVMPADQDYTGLTLNGKKRNLRRNDFLALAENLGIAPKVAANVIDMVVGKEKVYGQLIEESYVSDEFKGNMMELMEYRMKMLQ